MKRFACAAFFAVISFTFVGCDPESSHRNSGQNSAPFVTPVIVVGEVESSFQLVVKPQSQDAGEQIIITLLGVQGKPTTAMKLRDDEGVVHCLATYGYTDDFKPGCKLKVTCDLSRGFSHKETRETTNPDGSKSLFLVDEIYHKIISYKIIEAADDKK